jgi:glutamate racemase
MRIGVFDSGVGGLSVVNAIKAELPDLDVILKEDKTHLPYGSKTPEQIHSYVKPIFQEFIDVGCALIVVACNTVTTNLIKQLREEFRVPMVGIEPMVKPAAEHTKTGVIAVFATPLTLKSERYQWLKKHYAQGVKVIEPDASDWALMIENNQVDREKVAKRVNEVLEQGADQLVLGCTHYHWIDRMIKEIAGDKAYVIQPSTAVVAQLKRVLEQLP